LSSGVARPAATSVRWSADGVEVVVNDAILNDDMRISRFVEGAAEIAVHWRYRPLIDLRSVMPTLAAVVLRQRPETAVGVAVLRADAGCMTNVPRVGTLKMLSFNSVLQRARTTVGAAAFRNVSTSGAFGVLACRIGTSAGIAG